MTGFGLLTVLFAACSLIYELFLAQTLTSVLGGSNLRYALTIGLYISSMGLGAWLAWPLSDRLLKRQSGPPPQGEGREGKGGRAFVGDAASRLLAIEACLMTCGLLAAPFILVVEKLRVASVEWAFGIGSVAELAAGLLFHAPILVIGFLSGAELPLLMDCAARARARRESPPKNDLAEQESQSSGHFVPSILAWDYVGTVAGALLFPFALLPWLGVFGVSFLVVFFNGLGTLGVLALSRGSARPRFWLALCLVLSTLSLVLLKNLSGAHETLVQVLYFTE